MVKLKRKINLTKEKNGDQIEKNNIL